MKFKNGVFMNSKFMETMVKCNEFEDFPPKDAYWFNRFVKKIGAAQEHWEEIRVKLVKKHGEEQDDGSVTIPEKQVPEFQNALNEIMDIEFEIEGINKIKFPDELKLSPIEIGLVEEVFDMSVFEKSAENLL